jgi:hypothetical protein
MTDFKKLSEQERHKIKKELLQRYSEFQSCQITLDMTRGKPCAEQLDLALGMIEGDIGKAYLTQNGLDCRNYGGLDGIPAAKILFAEYMGIEPDELILGGNSSLNMMHDTILRAMVKGVSDSTPPWGQPPGCRGCVYQRNLVRSQIQQPDRRGLFRRGCRASGEHEDPGG